MLHIIKRIISKLFPVYILNEKYAFSSSIGGVFFNPFYFARKSLFKAIKLYGRQLSGCLLDVGCGSQPYRHLVSCTEYKGMEFDTPDNRKNKKADYFYDGVYFPMPDNSYDAVLCTQVLEHVFTPEIFIREISRSTSRILNN